MHENKKGFVLLEAITVITILCVILIVLYSAYSKLLINVKSKSLYDNTEYIYKTSIIRTYLESRVDVISLFGSNNYAVYCSNTLQTATNCSDVANYKDLFNFLGVSAIYFSVWNINETSVGNIISLEATTQNYIKQLDTTTLNGVYRIIVMYEDENNDTDKKIYQYATLRFGSRG